MNLDQLYVMAYRHAIAWALEVDLGVPILWYRGGEEAPFEASGVRRALRILSTRGPTPWKARLVMVNVKGIPFQLPAMAISLEPS